MISPTFNLREFLHAMIGEDYRNILIAAAQECAEAERLSCGVRGAVKARQMGSSDYIFALKKFLFFMQRGLRPTGVKDWEFAMYRSVCEPLVGTGEFSPAVLKLFR